MNSIHFALKSCPVPLSLSLHCIQVLDPKAVGGDERSFPFRLAVIKDKRARFPLLDAGRQFLISKFHSMFPGGLFEAHSNLRMLCN